MNQGLAFSSQISAQTSDSSSAGATKSDSNRSDFDKADVTVRKAHLKDARAVLDLYIRVSHSDPGHLVREADEVTTDFIHQQLHNAFRRGIAMVMELDDRLIGCCSAYTSEACSLAHVLTQTCIMIDPAWQNRGFGGMLLEAYLEEVRTKMRHIYRFELLPHQSDQRAIEFYEHHGFRRESEAIGKVRTNEGTFESEVTLVWFNPDFSEEQLRTYHGDLDCQL